MRSTFFSSITTFFFYIGSLILHALSFLFRRNRSPLGDPEKDPGAAPQCGNRSPVHIPCHTVAPLRTDAGAVELSVVEQDFAVYFDARVLTDPEMGLTATREPLSSPNARNLGTNFTTGDSDGERDPEAAQVILNSFCFPKVKVPSIPACGASPTMPSAADPTRPVALTREVWDLQKKLFNATVLAARTSSPPSTPPRQVKPAGSLNSVDACQFPLRSVTNTSLTEITTPRRPVAAGARSPSLRRTPGYENLRSPTASPTLPRRTKTVNRVSPAQWSDRPASISEAIFERDVTPCAKMTSLGDVSAERSALMLDFLEGESILEDAVAEVFGLQPRRPQSLTFNSDLDSDDDDSFAFSCPSAGCSSAPTTPDQSFSDDPTEEASELAYTLPSTQSMKDFFKSFEDGGASQEQLSYPTNTKASPHKPAKITMRRDHSAGFVRS